MPKKKATPLSPAPLMTQLPTSLPPPSYLDDQSPDKDFNTQDAQDALNTASFYHACWSHVHSLDDVIKLGDATIRLSQHRRKLFNKPYGVKDTSGKHSDVVYPID